MWNTSLMNSSITEQNSTLFRYINPTNISKISQPSGENYIHTDPTWLVLLRVILLSIVALLTILGNGLVLTCVCRIKEMKTVTGVFLANLAASDLGVGFLCIPVAIAASLKEDILRNNVTCHFNGFILVVFFIASIQTLSAISVHKYITVVHAMQTTVTKKRARISLGIIWFVSLLLAAGPLFGWSDYVYKNGRHQCGTASPTSPETYSHLILLLIFGYVLPLMTMLFCYSRLYCVTRQHIHRLKENAITSNNEDSSETQLINTLLIILLTFIICWLPFVVFICYGILKLHIPYYLPSIAFLFGYGNSALNPIIYALRHRSFRRGFWEILTVCFNENIRNRFATTATSLGKDNSRVSWPSPKKSRKIKEHMKDDIRDTGKTGTEMCTFLNSPGSNPKSKNENGVYAKSLLINEINA